MIGSLLSLMKRNKLNISSIFFIILLTGTLGTCFLEANQQMENRLEELQE